MVKRLDYSILGEYVEYLRTVRFADESRVHDLCTPLIRLIQEKGYTTDMFLEDSAESIYEILTGKLYTTGKKAKKVRQALNNYRSYAEQNDSQKESLTATAGGE